ncbi:metallophosphoesterase [Parapedobacter deserti]|uniref:Metallophosphoesterase n=1 Tax=Parapedobacter deserti TaxID=1912957 RepID=A0ABV7JS96_9SPHI
MKKKINNLMIGILLTLSLSCKEEKSFRIVLLPDTQVYSESYPEIFQAQTEWIVNNKDSIAFVLQQGDITNHNVPEQWKVAAEALQHMDNIVPYALATGNHDNGEKGHAGTRDLSYFNQYFPFDRYSTMPYFGGAMEAGKLDNYWCKFSGGGMDWLVLNLEFGPRNSVLKWADTVIQAHPQHKIIINTHAYMYSDETRMSPDRSHHWLPQSYGLGKDSVDLVNNGEEMWEKLVKKHANICIVVSGHVLNDGVGTLVSEGDHGNNVYQMLANFQGGVEGSINGGNGFLRILTIDPKQKTISVKTYSPHIDEYKTTEEHQFILTNASF